MVFSLKRLVSGRGSAQPRGSGWVLGVFVVALVCHGDELSELQDINSRLIDLVQEAGGSTFDNHLTVDSTQDGSLLVFDESVKNAVDNLYSATVILLDGIKSPIENIEEVLGDPDDGVVNDLAASRNEVLEEILEAIEAIELNATAISSSVSTAAAQASVLSSVNAVGGAVGALNLANGGKLDDVVLAIAALNNDNTVDANDIIAAIAAVGASNTAENLALMACIDILKGHLGNISNYMTGGSGGGLDQDNDVPKLEEIRLILENLAAAGVAIPDPVNVVQGVRLEGGGFKDLQEELEEMDIAATLSNTGVGFGQDKEDLLGVADDLDITAPILDLFDGSRSPVSLVLHHPFIQHNSPFYDVGCDTDVLGGITELGLDVPSLQEIMDWIKILLVCAGLAAYMLSLKDLLFHMMQLDMIRNPTQPITNYGGALGGVVNVPVRLMQIAVGVGMVAGIILTFTQALQMDGQPLTTTFQLAFGGLEVTHLWVVVALDLFDGFVPASYLVQLWLAYWTTKGAAYGGMWFGTRIERAFA